MTSHDALQVLKGKYGFGKLGHTGTLDPLACGLLGVLKDENTKLQTDLVKDRKTYRGIISLGVETDSLDSLGIPLRVSPVPNQIDLESVKNHLLSQKQYFPPLKSAVKVKGKRAYSGKVDPRDLQSRPLTFYSLELKQIDQYNISIFTEVESGTYVRSLAQMVGNFLLCGAHLKQLIRTKIHGFEYEGNIFEDLKILNF